MSYYRDQLVMQRMTENIIKACDGITVSRIEYEIRNKIGVSSKAIHKWLELLEENEKIVRSGNMVRWKK